MAPAITTHHSDTVTVNGANDQNVAKDPIGPTSNQKDQEPEQPEVSGQPEQEPEPEEVQPDDEEEEDEEEGTLTIVLPNATPNEPSPTIIMDKALTPFYKRMIILILTMIETIIFSGLIFGWPSLFYMLKNERIYAHLCATTTHHSMMIIDDDYDHLQDDDNNNSFNHNHSDDFNMTNHSIKSIEQTNSGCIPQENILNMAFTIGIFAMGFTSFAWGFLLESKGLRFVRIALNILITIGCLLLSLTTSETSMQIIPGIIILGLIGVPLRIANMQIADFFPTKRSTIISFYSGAFSASPIVFVLVKYVYDYWRHYSRWAYFWSTFILFIISVTILPLNTFLLPGRSVRKRENKLLKRFHDYNHKIRLVGGDGRTKRNAPKYCLPPPTMKQLDKPVFIRKSAMKLIERRFEEVEISEALLNDVKHQRGNKTIPKPMIVNFGNAAQHQQQNQLTHPQNVSPVSNDHQPPPVDTTVDIMDEEECIPLRVSLYSISFLMHQLWFSWINTYMVLYSGSMALWLERVTEDDQLKSRFTQTFGLVQCTALIIAPLAGFVMDTVIKRAKSVENSKEKRLIQAQSGFLPILFTTLTLVGAVVSRCFDTPVAVYMSIVFITILRALFIAVASAYLRVRYPANHFNRLNGIMCTIGAFFSLLQFPLFYFESKSLQGAYWVNIFCTVMTMISLLNPLSLSIPSLQKSLLAKERKHYERIRYVRGLKGKNRF